MEDPQDASKRSAIVSTYFSLILLFSFFPPDLYNCSHLEGKWTAALLALYIRLLTLLRLLIESSPELRRRRPKRRESDLNARLNEPNLPFGEVKLLGADVKRNRAFGDDEGEGTVEGREGFGEGGGGEGDLEEVELGDGDLREGWEG
jgi:hypothetical protein